MNHLFIVNPAAGKGISMKYIPLIEEAFKGKKDNCFIEITERPGHATEIAREYVTKDICRVYSVGGDGTLNEVLNGVVGSGSSLGVIPCGSGNDLIRTFCYSLGEKGRDAGQMEELLRSTIMGREKKIDIARVNGQYFINIASMGMDAEVAYNARRFKGIPGISGSMAYVMGILATVIWNKNRYMSISIDEKVISGRFLLVAAANGKYYGGGMMPAPEAKIDDGLFDICVINEVRKTKILRLFPEFMKGRHGEIEEVEFYKAKRLEIQCDEEISMNVDGEVKRVRGAVFELIPQGIDLILPALCPDEK